MRSFVLTLFLLSLYYAARAGTGIAGTPCSIGNNRLQTGTFQYWDECNSTTFCSDQGACESKRCRSDDFPFGYPQGSPLVPPKCPKGQFCPDEGSDCQPIIAVGQPCQLNRDDQCEGPPNFKELADTSGRGLNVNGSVCLNNICMWANATVGTACVIENTPFTVYGSEGETIDIVSRGNCQKDLWCDSQSKVCMAIKKIGEACDADKECDSVNCLASGVCGIAAATPRHFGIYIYILVGLAIIGAMGGILFGLWVTHRKQREIERAKRAQYWREQNAFHQNLMQMREAARASVLSLPHHSREFSDDANAPFLQSPPKSSGLRNYMDNDSGSDLDDLPPTGMLKQHGFNGGGRF